MVKFLFSLLVFLYFLYLFSLLSPSFLSRAPYYEHKHVIIKVFFRYPFDTLHLIFFLLNSLFVVFNLICLENLSQFIYGNRTLLAVWRSWGPGHPWKFFSIKIRMEGRYFQYFQSLFTEWKMLSILAEIVKSWSL